MITMPEFILDHGAPAGSRVFSSLDSFTQGYIEAMFFTASDENDQDAWGNPNEFPDWSVADLAPEALATIIGDCERFQECPALPAAIEEAEEGDGGFDRPSLRTGGMDFWYTRNGHGCGFWDGDWPEPWATQLDEAAKVFREVDLYQGDDGLLYLS